MLGFQCLLLCTVLYSATVDAFGECDDDGSCPDNATCEDDQCECKDGFDEIDVPGLTIGGTPMTVCVGMNYWVNIKHSSAYLYNMYIYNVTCLIHLETLFAV